MLVEGKEQIENDMQKEDAKEEKKEEEDNKGGDLVGEGEKSRKESNLSLSRTLSLRWSWKCFWILFLLCRPGANRERKLIHTEGLVIVDIYCEWCFSAITIITNADGIVKNSNYKGVGPAPPYGCSSEETAHIFEYYL